jgi:hypothetical protein
MLATEACAWPTSTLECGLSTIGWPRTSLKSCYGRLVELSRRSLRSLRSPSAWICSVTLIRRAWTSSGASSSCAAWLRRGRAVTSELPRAAETLLFRLLGAGRTLDDALTELDELAPQDAVRSAAIFNHGKLATRQRLYRHTHAKEFLMQTLARYEKWRNDAMAEGKAEAVLAVLRARGIDVDADAVSLIRSTTDLNQLDAWLVRAATAHTLVEVLEGPRTAAANQISSVGRYRIDAIGCGAGWLAQNSTHARLIRKDSRRGARGASAAPRDPGCLPHATGDADRVELLMLPATTRFQRP